MEARGCTYCGEKNPNEPNKLWGKQFHHEFGKIPEGEEKYIVPGALKSYGSPRAKLHLSLCVDICGSCHDQAEYRHFESQVERRYVSQYYYTPATKPTPWHEVRREIKSLWDVLKEKRAFTPTGGRAELFPYLSWDDFVNTVFLKTGFYVEDLSPSLTKEVWGTAQNGQTRNQRLRRMVLNYGKKVQGVCITCKQKCCRNMLAEHLTFLHGSHKPNSGKETNPSNLHNERNYDDWEEEFEKLWGYECNQCHGGD